MWEGLCKIKGRRDRKGWSERGKGMREREDEKKVGDKRERKIGKR